jgi:hypothetical protein
MNPTDAEGWVKVVLLVGGTLSGALSTWVLLRRDVADLKRDVARATVDINGLGTKLGVIVTQQALDAQRMTVIETEIKDLRFLERGIPDRFTRERHDLVDRIINPLQLRIDGRLDDLEEQLKRPER